MKLGTLCLAAAALVLATSNAWAQCSNCGTTGGVVSGGNCGGAGCNTGIGGNVVRKVIGSGGVPGGGGTGAGVNTDFTMPNCSPTITGYPRLPQQVIYAARDHYSPHPYYAYSRNGINASREDQWNTQMGQQVPWHGDYNYWRWGVPTALVVPPTAAFQSEYNWGVGQTRSMPIYHQFGSTNPSPVGNGSGMYPNAPYWPGSTSQYGIYPVRAPWH
jgi:hypothetical protein